eukprot:83999-Heterocapsa_arctica.AAC.1
MLQPEGIEWQEEPEHEPAKTIYELADVGAVAGPRERTVAASEPIKHTGGYLQIAPTYLKKCGNWDYTYVVQKVCGLLANIPPCDASILMKWRRGAKQALITTAM